MKHCYFAPLEGITTYIYRNLHHQWFGGMDKYFTPFVSPTSNRDFKSRAKKDVIPEHNRDIPVVPQILSNRSDEFLYTAERLAEYGYTEINLNLGCPSGTVVSKGRGSGFLTDLDGMDRFLYDIYENCPVPLSVKTRIGRYEPEEFSEILKIYNKYPIHELTIHPRVRDDFYKNIPNWDVFEYALEHSTNPVCYNGDLCTFEDYERFCERFPTVDRIMIGRGLIGNPGLVHEIQTGEPVRLEEVSGFMWALKEAYQECMADNPVLFKMKEIWVYLAELYPQGERLWKKIKKARRLSDYENIMRQWKF
ncbi:MAG: tRNA-dihydrouridine synthase family protein [Eubacterium sp.]|nr:tRNA-dihydrouridine synthase family protein [Eubacterium sp.]